MFGLKSVTESSLKNVQKHLLHFLSSLLHLMLLLCNKLHPLLKIVTCRSHYKRFPPLRNLSPKALCLAEDIAACLVEKLNMVLLNKIPKVQVSDTTGDAMKNKSWYHKNPVWPTSRILIIKFIKYRSFICVSAAG